LRTFLLGKVHTTGGFTLVVVVSVLSVLDDCESHFLEAIREVGPYVFANVSKVDLLYVEDSILADFHSPSYGLLLLQASASLILQARTEEHRL
jgi:hypothetical protein